MNNGYNDLQLRRVDRCDPPFVVGLRRFAGHTLLANHCPRCNGYVGIVLREPGRNMRLQAVNGKCLGCSYCLAWIVIRGGRRSAIGTTRRSSFRQRQLLT